MPTWRALRRAFAYASMGFLFWAGAAWNYASCTNAPTTGDGGNSKEIVSDAKAFEEPSAEQPSKPCWYREDASVDVAQLLCRWKDHPANPLIEPPTGQPLIADPTVLSPQESPDGKWHLFAFALVGIYHHISDDGVKWERLEPPLVGVAAVRPYIYKEDGVFYLFYEQTAGLKNSKIRFMQSTDLKSWTDPQTLLEPTLSWEIDTTNTVGNPFVVKRDGTYWLYYSASGVLLPETNFYEPQFIGLASASKITGPYTKRPQPILSPQTNEPYRNFGAGSLKLFDERVGGYWIALNNGIYLDAQKKSRSAIMVLKSRDGIAWEKACLQPILAPSDDQGWKSAFVYAFDLLRVGIEIWVYYNGRDGWASGKERIGLSMLSLPCQR